MTAVLSTAQDAFFDVLKTVPLLLLVYALLYYIENRLTDTPALLSRTAQFGPAVGALAGSIPQCGFSAAASALFSAGYLAPATLVAVFLATSDEAVPVMLAGGASAKSILALARRQVRSCRTRRLSAALYRVPQARGKARRAARDRAERLRLR